MFQFLLYAIFFSSAVLLILVILLQESKGGGLSEAFGGAGAETFGPRAGGISKFTFGLFGAWILSALALHWTADPADSGSVMGDPPPGAAVAGPPEAPPAPPALPAPVEPATGDGNTEDGE
ncbi:MAG: preprotein translocase subunit SecG [Planctomycetes bacterium]|nr:preprotein translocase subunit SecG [Planctomycetota bacterium]MBL7009196.1 preprotein translocase subunit SecG [Planctomycetota bacterium]